MTNHTHDMSVMTSIINGIAHGLAVYGKAFGPICNGLVAVHTTPNRRGSGMSLKKPGNESICSAVSIMRGPPV